MRYLLMGHGAIGSTLLALFENLNESADIRICDPKENGITGQEMIIKEHDSFDAVINLSYEATPPVMELCNRYGLAYMDAGFESIDDENSPAWMAQMMEAHDAEPSGRHLLGCGMNPGLIEYIAAVYAPKKPHIAVEFETDLPLPAKPADRSLIYGTWCPLTYYYEAVDTEAFVMSENGRCIRIPKPRRYGLELVSRDGAYVYDITPHDEMYSMTRENPLCRGSVFLYHAPSPIRNYLLQGETAVTAEEVMHLPVLHELTGTDSVGMLFYDGSDHLYYAVNRASHEECYRKFGYNATCWQVACGVYVGMKLLPLLPDRCHMTLARAAGIWGREIGELLEHLSFRIEVVDDFMDAELFRERILPLFGGLSV